MKIAENASVASLTTFKVGGAARYHIVLETADEAPDAVSFAITNGVPLIPIGRGSNILGRDEDCDIALVTVGMSAVRVDGDTIIADAGALWDDVVITAVDAGLWGIENLSAIPGTVGGAVVQNVGAYGQVLSRACSRVVVFDTKEGVEKIFSRFDCAFGYRTSIFKNEPDRYLIPSSHFFLSHKPNPVLSYKDLAEHFGAEDSTLLVIRDSVVEIRKKKFPPLDVYGTAGSFFLNPILDEESAFALQEIYPAMPVFSLPEGGVKVPIAWFLDHVLKLRGEREGNVEAWRDHVLAIVAHPGASASDVRNFARKISDRIHTELRIVIEPEVRFL